MRHETQNWDQIRARVELITLGAGQTGLTPTVAVQRVSDSLFLQSGGGSWGAGFATNNMTAVDAANLPGSYKYDVPLARLDLTAGGSGYRFKIAETTTSTLEYVFVEQTAQIDNAAIADAVWDEARSGHVTAGTFGQGVASVQGNVTGSAASVVGAVGSVTGNVGGNVTGSVGSVATDGISAASLAASAGAEIADAVWDEVISGHLTAGTTGATLNSAAGPPTASQIADAVWDEGRAGHVNSGSMGLFLQVLGGLVQYNQRLSNPTYDANGRLLTADLIIYPTGTDAQNETSAITTITVTMEYDVNGNLESLLAKE